MAKPLRVTYEPGQFSQVNLPDGKKVLISVGSTDVRVVRLGLMNLPMGTVWSYDCGFPIRTDPSKSTSASISLMNAILSLVEGCQTIQEIPDKLSQMSRDLDSMNSPHHAPSTSCEPDRALTNDLMSRMTDGVNLIKMGIHARLTKRYERSRPEMNPPVCAAAVVNLLFGEAQTSPPADDFYREQPLLVRSELNNLTVDDEIKYAFTQAIRVQLTMLQQIGKITAREATERLEKSLNAGLLIPGGDFPTPASFLQFADRFFRSAGVS